MTDKTAAPEPCPRCRKPPPLCVCSAIVPVRTSRDVLILQHPREPDRELGTAIIAHLALHGSTLRVGLSWPNLGAALGRPARAQRWLVLHLGSARPRRPADGRSLILLDRRGAPQATGRDALADIDGVVALDGTWSQAKTLWWRNGWLLKLQRAVLAPRDPSLYRQLRREPRQESLSTLEALGLALADLEGQPQIVDELLRPFRHLLAAARRRR
jgi:DTW domain-containing protein YfiP